MKKLLLLLLLLPIVSCTTSTPKKGTRPKLAAFLFDFVSRHHDDFYRNDVIEERMNASFRKELESELKNKLLDLIPLRLYKVSEYKKGCFSATFELNCDYKLSDYYFINSFDTTLYVKGNVVVLVTDSIVATLKEENHYYVTGDFIKHIGIRDFAYYSPYTMAFSISTGIRGVPSNANVELGLMLFDINSIKECSYREIQKHELK